MSDIPTKTLVVIVGPTAVGKTAAAVWLAKHLNTVVISADSRQFYQEMSIGTAKPSATELEAVQHYFIGSHSISELFSVGDFEKQGLALIAELFKTNAVVILTGGSGLYVKAICEGFDQIPSATPLIRDKLNKELEISGLTALQQKLKLADPVYYEQVDLNNPQRIIRALEVFERTGQPISAYRLSETNTRPFDIIKIGLNLPREVLYNRINLRVDDMMRQGLLNEVKSLLAHRHLNALNTVGYSELFDYFDGEVSLEAAIDRIKQNTRRFAKRQLTWFRKDNAITWFEVNDLLKDQLSGFIREKGIYPSR